MTFRTSDDQIVKDDAPTFRSSDDQLVQSEEPQAGQELGSTEATTEELKQSRLAQIQAESGKSDQARTATAKGFLSGSIDAKDMGIFDLMESVNQARTIQDRGKRSKAVALLKQRGVPADMIETFTKLDDPTGFMQSLKENAVVGGASGISSGITGLITKSPRKAAAAAAIAAGVAEAGQESFDRIFRPERARDPFELGVDVAKSAAFEGVGDLVGAKAFSLAGKGIKAVGSKLFVGGRVIEGAEAMSKELAKVGKTIKPEDIPQFLGKQLPNIEAGLDPAQKSSSKLTAWLMGSLERAFGGGRLLERKETVNPVVLKKIVGQDVDNLMGDLAKLSITQRGALANDAFGGSQKVFRQIDNMNFSGFKEAIDVGTKTTKVSKRVPTGKVGSNLKKIFKTVTEEVEIQPQVDMKINRSSAKDLLDQVNSGKLLSGFDEDKQFIKNMTKIADSTNIEQAIKNRSNLNALADRLPKGSNARRLANQMKAELKAQMIKTAKGVSPEAARLGEQAYTYSSQARKMYFPKVLEMVAQDVADGVPNNVASEIFQPQGVTRINQAKDVLLSKKGKLPIDIQKHKTAWDELRFGWLRDEIKKASDVDEIPIFGDELQGVVDEMGEEAMSAMFSGPELKGIQNTINKMRFVQRQATGGSAELARFVQVGAAAGGRFGGKPGLMMTALGGPAVLARAMANKNAGGIFLGGKTGQFLGLMAKTKLGMEKERKKIKELNIRSLKQKALSLGARDE